MADRFDPYGGYNFRLEIEGIQRAGFKACSGLETSQTPGTYREGTDRTLYMRKIPGLVSVPEITLSGGVTNDRELFDWRQKVASGLAERRNMSIVLLNDVGEESIRWNLINCWPSKWTGPSLDATADEFAIETLEIAHEGLSVDTWK